MVFGLGHLIGGWIFGRIWQILNKIKLDSSTWFCLLLAAILPDIDFLIDWTFGLKIHRTFTHSFLFAIMAGLVFYMIFSFLRKNGNKKYFGDINPIQIGLAFFIGISSHLFFDAISSPGVPLFWPLSKYFSIFGITSFAGSAISEYPLTIKSIYWAIFDMGLGSFWILWMTLRGRLKP